MTAHTVSGGGQAHWIGCEAEHHACALEAMHRVEKQRDEALDSLAFQREATQKLNGEVDRLRGLPRTVSVEAELLEEARTELGTWILLNHSGMHVGDYADCVRCTADRDRMAALKAALEAGR